MRRKGLQIGGEDAENTPGNREKLDFHLIKLYINRLEEGLKDLL